jgi:hypothetical protein
MVATAPSLSTEVAKRKSYPKSMNQRERQVLGSVKNYVDAADATKQASLTMGQATTGTAGTAGEIAITSMTSTGKVVVTAAEALGNNIVISHVIAATGKITVYVQDTNVSGAATALSGKKVNYIVIALS